MASLTPQSRALIQAGRRALRATPADRERIEAALRAKLGPAVLPPIANAAPVARMGWHLAAKAAAAACVVGGALYLAVAPRLPPAARNEVARPVQVAPVEAARAPAVVPAVEKAPLPSPAATKPLPVSTPPRRHDRLAQEVALLSHATSALKAGRAADALRSLDLHQRRFPAGVLTEERLAAKAQALCLLGRIDEGRRELGHLAANSPGTNRAKQVCDGAQAHAHEP